MRFVRAVGLQRAATPLVERLDVGLVQVPLQPLPVRGARPDHRPHHGEVPVEPAVQRRTVVDLDRHPRRGIRHDGDRVREPWGEQVVAVPLVEELPIVGSELARERRTEQVVDLADGVLRRLVVDGVVVRREERTVVPELVVIGEHRRRVLLHQRQLALGLHLRAHQVVLVQVEREPVPAEPDLTAVGVLRRDDHDQGAFQDVGHAAVVPVGELVQQLERGVGAALLAAVQVPRDPQDHRRGGGQSVDGRLGRGGVTDRGGVGLDLRQPLVGDVRGVADERVADRAPAYRRAERPHAHPVAGRADRIQIGVDLVGGGLPIHPDREAQHILGRGHDALEARRRRERIAGAAAPFAAEGLGDGERGRCHRPRREPYEQTPTEVIPLAHASPFPLHHGPCLGRGP